MAAPDHLVDAVFRELGHLIVGLLPLRDVALGTFTTDIKLRGHSRDRIDVLWPMLSPLLGAPFGLTRRDLLCRRELSLFRKRIGVTELQTLSSAIAIGALLSLLQLNLVGNQISDAGLTAFAEALQQSPMGALPAKLKILDLSENGIGDAGLIAFAEALKSPRGALGSCTKIYLSENKIGDVGMQALATAVSSGALPKLETLFLGNNKIGDAGLIAFAEALKSPRGGLPKLEKLFVFGNPGNTAGVVDACKLRKTECIA